MAKVGDIGTLKELGVVVGDVVDWISEDGDITHTIVRLDRSTVYLFENKDEHKYVFDWPIESSYGTWRLISSATQQTKLWRDMTPEEKGALLLAVHEGSVIEWSYGLPWVTRNSTATSIVSWSDECAYRIKLGPKVETVALCWRHDVGTVKNKIGTINLIDGKPDCASIKMEEL